MKTTVEFRSDKFPPYEDEEREINPGRFGRRLAEFVSAGLSARGFAVEPLIAEGWGWVIPIRNERFKLWIGCGNYEEYPDGFLCFIEPHKPAIWKLFRRINTRPTIEALQQAMDAVLSEEAGIRQKKWWTHEEFNSPPS